LVDPRDKEKIAESGLQDRGSREKAIRVGLMKGQEADLIADSLSFLTEMLFRAA
jgi:hypothetical protein